MLPMQYAVYKGIKGKNGALQLNFQAPHFYNDQKQKDFTGELAYVPGSRKLREGWKQREGAIFLEITSAVGPNEYDWENKITVALSVNDMGKILHTLVTGEECRIMHDPGAKTETAGAVTKSLNIQSPNGTAAGVMVYASMRAGGQEKKHTVPISGDEVLVIRQLLQTAIARALAW